MTLNSLSFLAIDLFLISFFGTLIVTPLIRKFALKYNLIDHPTQRKIHQNKIARIGGVGIYFGIALSLIFAQIGFISLDRQEIILPILLGATLTILVGLWDDIKKIPAPVKLLFQFFIAWLTLRLGIRIDFITNPASGGVLYLGQLAFPLTMIWIVAMMNMINLIDGVDGLAAGVTAIASLILGVAAIMTGRLDAAVLAFSLMGACLAFLRYNFNPASIFMGDCGSLLLGYLLAVLSIVGVMKSTATIAIAVPILVLILPISDTGLAIFRRLKAGNHIFRPDSNHLHHQLLSRGFSQKQVALIFYYATFSFGLVGLISTFVKGLWLLLWLAITFYLLVLFTKFFKKA